MNYNNKVIDLYQFISIPITAAAGKYFFPDLPNLRNVNTYGFASYNPTIITTDNTGVSLDTNYTRVFVTLVTDNEEFIQKMDLSAFTAIAGDTGYYNPSGMFQIDNKKISFAKSYVEYAFGTAAIGYPRVLCFGVYYSENKPHMGV